MTTTEKKTLAKGLAWRIAVATEAVDPWGFDDAFSDMKEAAFCNLSVLETDPYTIFDQLEQWIDDIYDEQLKKTLSALRQDVAEYMTA